MLSLSSVLLLAHLLGLALALGCATAKLGLLIRCGSDPGPVSAYLAVAGPLTRWIVLGLALLTLSGVSWLLLGRAITPLLATKLVLVGVIWVLGPIIDKVIEPEYRALAPGPGTSASFEFLRVRRRYLLLESMATGLFYIIVAVWVLA